MAETSKNKIYYNDNENSVADVLADMKKMAESTDEAIEKSKYNDAAIKKSISDVEKKQVEKNTEQDSKIVELQTEKAKLETELKEMQEDFYQNSIRGQASGEYIHVEDSSNCRAKIGISGNSEQETREGYNQFKIQSNATSDNGVTITKNNDSSVTYSGTTTGSFWHELANYNSLKITKKMYIKNYGSLTNANLIMQVIRNGDTSTSYIPLGPDSTLNVGDTLINVYAQQTTTGKAVSGTLDILLTDYENKDKGYEQYGAMPSPDYPSEIKTVGSNGSVKVTKCNKNLSKYKTFTSTSSARVVGDTTTSGQQIEGIKIRKGKKYTISFDVVSLPSSDYRIQIRESTDESVAQTDGEIPNSIQNEPLICNTLTRHSKTITAQGDNYIYIKCIPNGFVLDNIQVEEKETSTSFEQHEEQSYIMPVQQEMLQGDYFDFDNEEEVHTWNKLVLTGNENLILDDTYKGITQFSVLVNALYINDDNIRAISNYFKGVFFNLSWEKNNTVTIIGTGSLRFMTNKYTSVDDFKAWLKTLYNAGTPVMIYYKLKTPTRLAFTDEQKAVAKELNNARTYKNVTNITTDSKAILSLDYAKDLETLLNNTQALAVNNASEGV